MLDKRNRLVKLAREYDDYEVFKAEAIRKPRWYFRPWVSLGYEVTNGWLNNFYKRVRAI